MKQKANLFILLLSMIVSQAAFSQKTLQGYEAVCVLDKKESIDFFFSSTDYYSFSEDVAFISYGGKWGAINSSGKLIIPFKYQSHGEFSDGLAPVSLNDKWGFINKQGTLVVPTKYDSAENFRDGLACVELNGKFGAINKQGVVIIPIKYDKAFSFSEGLASVLKDGKYGFINKNGSLVISCKFQEAEDFSDGLSAVRLDSKYGYIDKEGKVVLPFNFLSAGNFKDGFARVSYDNDKNEIVGGLSALLFLATGKLHSFYEFIDKTGKIIHSGSLGEYNYGLLSFVDKNGKYGFKDKNGNLVISCEYDDADRFSEGLARVKKGERYGYIDKLGRVVVPIVYDDGGVFKDGIVWVEKNGKYGFANNLGKEITPFVFDGLASFSDGFACVELNNKFGFIDRSGNPLDLDLDLKTTQNIAVSLVHKYDNETDTVRKKQMNHSLLKWLRKGASKGDYQCCSVLGNIYYLGACGLNKNYAEAIKWSEKSLPMKDSNGNNYKIIGYCYSEGGNGVLKDDSKAFQSFLSGAKYNNEECYYALAISYLKELGCEKNPQQACVYADKLYSSNKKQYASIYALSYNSLAYDYANKKNFQMAINSINKAIEANASTEETANYYDSKGEIYLKMGKESEAINMWKKVMELDKDNLDFYKQNSELYKYLKAKGKL